MIVLLRYGTRLTMVMMRLADDVLLPPPDSTATVDERFALLGLLVLALVEDDRVDEARQILESLNSASLDAGTLNRARDAVNAASNR